MIHPHRTLRRFLIRGGMLGVGISLLTLAALGSQQVALGGHHTLVYAVIGAVLSLWGCLKR